MQKQNDVFYIQEAFKKLQLLNEDSFDLQDVGVVDELTSFVADDIDAPWVEEIIDVEAEDIEDVQDSYIGKVVLQCNCCNTRIYKDAKEVFVDEEQDAANIDEECPVCNTLSGWHVLGKIEPFNDSVEEEQPEEVEVDLDLDLTDDEINEALKKSISEDLDIHVQQDENGNVEEVIIEKESEDAVVIENETPVNLPADDIDVVVDVDESCHSKLKEEVDIKVDSTPEGELIAEVEVDEGEHVEVVEKEDVELPADDIEVVEEGCHDKLKEELNDEFQELEAVNIDDEDASVDAQKLENPEEEPVKEELNENLEALEAGKIYKSSNAGSYKFVDIVETEEGKLYRFKPVNQLAVKTSKEVAVDEPYAFDGEYSYMPKETVEYTFFDDIDESLNEDIENLSLDTESTHMEMTSDENGKVVVMTEPREEVEEVVDVEDEMIAPLTDEEKVEIENNEEVVEEEPVVEDEFEIDEFEEETFNELGESFLKRIYENVNSFKTSSVAYKKGRLVVEGLIKFNSGKEKSTSFIFEKFKKTKRDKVVIVGLNETFSKSKSAFMLKGDLKDKKFISESMIYNYSTRTINEDNKSEAVKIYGRAVIKK